MEHENRLTNEANVITSIRSIMNQLKILAAQYRRNYLEQYEMHISDINAPTKVGRFTDLDENQSALWSEYDSTVSEIEFQLTIYDKFCEDNQLNHSEPWSGLVKDLTRYRSGIRGLADHPPTDDTTPSPYGLGEK